MYTASKLILFTAVPSPPREIKVVEVQQDSITLEWSAPENTGGLDLLGYVVERREVGRQQWVRVGQTAPDVLTIVARNLLEGRPYAFRIMAENQEGLSEPAVLLKPVTPERPIGKLNRNHESSLEFDMFFILDIVFQDLLLADSLIMKYYFEHFFLQAINRNLNKIVAYHHGVLGFFF